MGARCKVRTKKVLPGCGTFAPEKRCISATLGKKFRAFFPILAVVLFARELHGNPVILQARLWMLEKYEHLEPGAIVDSVKIDLRSNDALVQDAGCLLLLKALEGLKRHDEKSDIIFSQLAADQNVVISVADIVDSRLIGWYNPVESEEIDDDLAVYLPLLVILGKADSKVARHTLSRTFLCLRGHPEALELVPVNKAMVSFTINRLQVITNRNCCMYPGKEIIIDMLEKDYRFRLLEVYRRFLEEGTTPDETAKKEMIAFISECMNFGDAKNGYVIRILAAKLAAYLVSSGETELLKKIKTLSEDDPFYVHVYVGRAGYSLTELNYPVREACRKLVRNQTDRK